jgi:hypothetical protein
MLEIHPAHHAASTWREFFIHIATIVLGLLIAVGLEQMEKYFHCHQEVPFPVVKDLASVKITLIRTRCFPTSFVV